MRERSIDLLPKTAKLVGIDEETALVRDTGGVWRVNGSGVVTVYDGRSTTPFAAGSVIASLTA
jgi:cyanophycinase-like exopeptidase